MLFMIDSDGDGIYTHMSVLLLLPLALQPVVGFGLSNTIWVCV